MLLIGSVHHRILRRLEIRSLEELDRECDFRVRRLLEEHFIADLDGPATHFVVAWNMLAENLAECPRLHALLIKEGHSVEQPVGLFLGRLPMDADILSAEGAALALHGVPDGVAFVAADKRDLDSIHELFHSCILSF